MTMMVLSDLSKTMYSWYGQNRCPLMSCPAEPPDDCHVTVAAWCWASAVKSAKTRIGWIRRWRRQRLQRRGLSSCQAVILLSERLWKVTTGWEMELVIQSQVSQLGRSDRHPLHHLNWTMPEPRTCCDNAGPQSHQRFGLGEENWARHRRIETRSAGHRVTWNRMLAAPSLVILVSQRPLSTG